MGTTIRLEAQSGENTTDEQWQELFKHFKEGEYNPEMDSEFITMDLIQCSYSAAKIWSHLPKDISSLKGSGITINLWFEEREPDESITL